ncbi:hypothetical protein CRYUN_Cryun37aG0015700 [Craigia yunnanensis]
MVGALQGNCPPHMAAALAEVIRDEGLMGLYRGWGASCLKVKPSSGAVNSEDDVSKTPFWFCSYFIQ